MDTNDPESRFAELSEELEELRQAHTACLRELESAHREAEQSAEDARIAQDELQYFVYAAGHDLQQPLRAIGTHAQLLQREYPNDDRAREFTTVIINGAAQMNALVRDLLTYSRTGNTAQQAPVNLNAPLQWALFNLAQSIQESGARIVTSGQLPEALADEKQMVTVFEHLLTNSIRYRSSEPPQIEIAGEEGDEFHTISVHDNGVGIKPEYQEKVFEPFKRLHNKEIPGSGLGLAICRKIVRAHHGKIWVESDGQHGSVVKFTVPA
jgi:signal transduction histidine kinase